MHHLTLIKTEESGTSHRAATCADMSERPPVILIVDDEVLLRMLAVDFFEDSGYEVLEARDGTEAIELIRKRPDIKAVFTDVQMPGRPDGFGVARQARDEIPGCAIVVVSARQWPDADSLASGVRFITKPYNGTQVVRMFDDMLAAQA